jgi:hypothetical protein
MAAHGWLCHYYWGRLLLLPLQQVMLLVLHLPKHPPRAARRQPRPWHRSAAGLRAAAPAPSPPSGPPSRSSAIRRWTGLQEQGWLR